MLVWLIVTDDPPGVKSTPRKETLRESIAGIWQVIRTPSMVRVFMVQLSSYPSYVLVVGLWGGPYLTHVYGYDLKGRGDVLFVAALAQVLGSFFWGPSDRLFGRYKLPVLIGVGTCFTSLVLLATLGKLPVPLLLDRVRDDRLFHRHDLGGDVARPLAGRAAPAGTHHHACSTSEPWAADSWSSSSAGPSSTCSRPRLAPTRWTPIGSCLHCKRCLVLTGFLVYFGSRESHLGRP